jgi:predicted TIM-barrel fold metal-dependent hydrolase
MPWKETCDSMTRPAERPAPRQQVTRRDVLMALGSVGLSLASCAPSESAWAQSPVSTTPVIAPPRIDVHHHILPPEYVRSAGKDVIGRPAPNASAPTWDIDTSLRFMDESGISSAVVSVSAPGVWFGDARLARRLARSCNEFAAQMAADHPGRFGFFATLPLPDIRSSLIELTHAVEVLHCDGVCLMTNYGHRYLGDAHFMPLFDELNRRRVVVHVHPMTCSCDLNVLPNVPASMIEFPHSTTRAIVSLLHSDAFARCRDIPFIFSHAGGTIPLLADRIAGMGAAIGKRGWLGSLQRLRYDTAGSTSAAALAPLLKLVTSKAILFGTDFPFTPERAAKSTTSDLHKADLPESDLRDIEGENAIHLFPRFAR